MFQLKSTDEKISNTHVLINNCGDLVSVYRKIHLFDMDNKETGVRLLESDYVLKGAEILPPAETPIGLLGLSIVSFKNYLNSTISLSGW